ncbi:metallophosphoesterase [Luteimonas deserti]|uniref:metallophosphoesterase n=1 Tax=Luteimonas deserti TaxID=2752306 RepID=UPI002E2D3CFF|nr:metallophosphoesterase [Luteimonas deserti]
MAFMPDVHFHDVYADFGPGSFAGVPNPANGRAATIRTMDAQLTSTRLFNENYFAFLAALDDAVARGATLIALPGDFSDDGQPVHLRGLVRVLDEYTARHGVRFFVVPGNHDPVRPFEQPGGKRDYLGLDPASGRIGAAHGVFSRGAHPACDPTGGEPAAGVDCSEDVRHLGHAGVTAALAGHGFMPRPADRYWATPYSRYDYEAYSFEVALEQARWPARVSTVCREGAPSRDTARTWCRTVPDASYVVEPVDGLWLVGLDANVYVPDGPAPDAFTGSGNQGYDRMLSHKPHVIAWLRAVVEDGAARGKQVVAFSHFPMTEFYNGASDMIASLLGEESMQLARRPADTTTDVLAGTGLRVHVGGHMHLNDIAVHPGRGDRRALFNIQAPSLAAYVPAYTLMTLDGSPHVDVRTVVLDAVPRFDELFGLYRAEYAAGARWTPSILDARDYRDYSRRALTELVRLRLLESDWPCDMRELVRSPLTGADLLVLAQLQSTVTLADLAVAPAPRLSPAFFACFADADPSTRAASTALAGDLAAARERARRHARTHGVALDDLGSWQAFDLAVDLVRLANAGDLASDDIGPERTAHYALLAAALAPAQDTLASGGGRLPGDVAMGRYIRARLKPLLAIQQRLAAGTPTRHVRLDLERDRVIDLTPPLAD